MDIPVYTINHHEMHAFLNIAVKNQVILSRWNAISNEREHISLF